MAQDNTFDFQQARLRHIGFKSRLRSALYGSQTNEETISSEFECSLGKWIHGHAISQYKHIPEMAELNKVHSQMHTVARGLLSLYHSGQVEKARSGLQQIDAIASRLVALLDIIELKANQ